MDQTDNTATGTRRIGMKIVLATVILFLFAVGVDFVLLGGWGWIGYNAMIASLFVIPMGVLIAVVEMKRS